MRGTWLLALVVLLSLFRGGRLEDLVIAQAGHLTVVSLCSTRQLRFNTSAIQQVSAMAYDSSTERLIISGSDPAGAHRLYTLQLQDGARPEPVTFSGPPPGRLEGMVISSDHAALFATDATSGAIVRVSLRHLRRGAAVVSVLHLLPDDRPRGLAVDEQNGLLFWTNWRFGRQSVERSRVDGSERRRLVDRDLYLPSGVAVDASSSSRTAAAAAAAAAAVLFFSDTAADGRLRVELAAEDGSDRRLVYRGRHPLAAGLQLAAGRLYWSDVSGVWRLAVPPAAAAAERVAPLSARPAAVLVIREEEQCSSYSSSAEPPPPLATVPPPAAQLCDDYCVVGRCRWDELRGRQCRCPPGFSGQRCQRDVCHNFCLSGGTCSRGGSGGRPRCICPPGVGGERCQLQSQSQPQDVSGGSVAVLGLPVAAVPPLLLCLLTLLTLLAGLLLLLGVRLRRAARLNTPPTTPPPTTPPPRPAVQRQVKRFVGRHLRPRPPPQRDIEDCCQMTLCETPCAVSTSACERQSLVVRTDDDCGDDQTPASLF